MLNLYVLFFTAWKLCMSLLENALSSDNIGLLILSGIHFIFCWLIWVVGCFFTVLLIWPYITVICKLMPFIPDRWLLGFKDSSLWVLWYLAQCLAQNRTLVGRKRIVPNQIVMITNWTDCQDHWLSSFTNVTQIPFLPQSITKIFASLFSLIFRV